MSAHRQAKAGSEIKEEISIDAEGYWNLNKKTDSLLALHFTVSFICFPDTDLRKAIYKLWINSELHL